MGAFRCCLFAALYGVGACTTSAQGLKLLPLAGELSGDFTLLKTPGAPKLHWTASVRDKDEDGKTRVLAGKVEGPGTRLRLALELAADGEGSWSVEEGEIELSSWFRSGISQWENLPELAATGVVKVGGRGLIRSGVADGNVTLRLEEGRLENIKDGWALEGVLFAGEFMVAGSPLRMKSLTPFELTVRTITSTRCGARNARVRGTLNEDQSVTVTEARVEIAGGEITLEDVSLVLSPFVIEATVALSNVGLQDLAALVPASLSDARGRIDGTVRLRWATEGGFQVGAGNLALGRSEPAIVRLAPSPGFLTQSMPKRFAPMPAWTGPLARWLSADNPAYHDMAEIELGRAPLEVESLAVLLTPDGDASGRTATVRMKARPTKPGASVKSVNIDVNVTGPLDAIFQLGLNRELSVEARP